MQRWELKVLTDFITAMMDIAKRLMNNLELSQKRFTSGIGPPKLIAQKSKEHIFYLKKIEISFL